MSGAGQRRPVERDEGPPGEIVEVGVGVGLNRGNVFNAIGRYDRRAVVCSNRHGEWRTRDQRSERDPQAQKPLLKGRGPSGLRVETPAQGFRLLRIRIQARNFT